MTPLQEALAPKSDQLAGDDLIAGPRTIRITEARVIEGDKRGEKKLALRFDGDNGKPFKPCKTMGRAMILAWGVTDDGPELPQMVGKSITVYRDPDVDFGPDKGVGGVRISHMSHLTGPAVMKLQVSKGKKSQFVFQPIVADVVEMKQPPAVAMAAWAENHIGHINRAPDLDKLDAFVGKRAGKIAELPDNLQRHCAEAYDARRIALAQEGKPDDQFGEDNNGDPFAEGAS